MVRTRASNSGAAHISRSARDGGCRLATGGGERGLSARERVSGDQGQCPGKDPQTAAVELRADKAEFSVDLREHSGRGLSERAVAGVERQRSDDPPESGLADGQI